MKKSLLIGLMLLSGVIAVAQSNYKEGYVITLQGDTLWGEIDYRGSRTMRNICRFKQNNSITEFTPNDITAYRFINSKYFVAREVDGKKHFLEFLIKGKLNLYTYDDLYYVEKEDIPLTLLPYEKGKTYKEDGKEYFYKQTQLKGRLVYYTQDAPQLQQEISNITEPSDKNLIQIAKNYHDAVCKDEACIIFEKKLPPVRVKAEIIAQGYKYRKINDIVAFYGALLHFWLPRQNENLYIKTGFITGEFEKERLYRIPLQAEYVAFPTWKIRPFVSGGYDVYINAGGLIFSAGTGFLYTKNKFSVSLSYELETEPLFGVFPFPTHNLLGHSLSLGVGYTF